MTRRFAFLSAATLLMAGLAAAQAPDPFIGTWQLDPDNSKFDPGPGPTDRTMKFEMTPNGLHHQTLTPTLFAGTNIIDYTAKFDGKDYEITGSGLDTVSLKRIDAKTIERTGKESGKVSESCTMTISADGKTLKVTTKGNFRGTPYSSVQILKREP
jgi:hypothetical protein